MPRSDPPRNAFHRQLRLQRQAVQDVADNVTIAATTTNDVQTLKAIVGTLTTDLAAIEAKVKAHTDLAVQGLHTHFTGEIKRVEGLIKPTRPTRRTP